MRSEWQEKIFSKVVKINPKRQLKRGSYVSFLSMSSVEPNRKNPIKIIRKKYSGGGAKFKNGDTLLARITPCLEHGKTVFLSDLEEGEVGFGSTEFIVLSGKEGVTGKRFVYYLCRYDKVRDFLIKSMTGSSGRQRVQTDAFDHLKIKIPPLQEQRRIVEILGSLDDKIELNYEMNKVLEVIIQVIFNNWFIDFEPFKDDFVYNEELDREIPKGWEIRPFSEVIYVNPSRKLAIGTLTKKVSMSDLKPWQSWIESWYNEEYKSGPKFQNGDILFARITPSLEHGKTALISFLNKGEIAFGSTEFIILAPKSIPSSYFVFCLARTYEIRERAIRAMSGSSGRQRVPNDIFDHIMIPEPPLEIVERFDSIARPVFEVISINGKENRVLAQIRDTLLPKLFSGEIRMRVDIEKEFPEEIKKLEEIKEGKAKIQKSIVEWVGHA